MRPMIAQQCSKRWTNEDETDLRAHLAALKDEVDAAGGPATWMQTVLIPSLARPAAPCAMPRLHARPASRRQHA